MRAWVEKGAIVSRCARKKTHNLNIENVKNILVIRHAALGDMIQTRPFLVELRKCFPNAKITLSLISNYQYAAPLDLVDSVHVLEGSDQRSISIFTRVKNFLSLPSFDLLFDLACTSRSKILTLCTKAKLKLSFPYKPNLCLYDVCLHRSDFRFEAENLLEFLFYFGHQSKYPIDYQLPQNTGHSNSVLLFFGASNMNRCYPLANWEELLKKLCTTFSNLEFVILEGHQQHEKYDDIFKRLSTFKNIRYQSKLDLAALSKIMINSKAFISSDTGLRHIAISHSTPTIGFFFNTCPGRNLPTYENKHLILLDQETGHPSVQNAFDKTAAFLRQI